MVEVEPNPTKRLTSRARRFERRVAERRRKKAEAVQPSNGPEYPSFPEPLTPPTFEVRGKSKDRGYWPKSSSWSGRRSR